MIENDHLIFDTEKGLICIPLKDIYRLQANKEYSTIHACKGQYTICRHLKFFEKLLQGYCWFFRTHKSEIINLKQIKNFNMKCCLYILNDGYANKVARRRAGDFAEAYKIHA